MSFPEVSPCLWMLWIAILVALKPPTAPPWGIMICFIQKWPVFLFCVSIIGTVQRLDLCCCKNNRCRRRSRVSWRGGDVCVVRWSYVQCETLKNWTWNIWRAILSNPISVLDSPAISEGVRGKTSVENLQKRAISSPNPCKKDEIFYQHQTVVIMMSKCYFVEERNDIFIAADLK